MPRKTSGAIRFAYWHPTLRLISNKMIPSTINIVTAERAGDFRILLGFDDGTSQMVDFEPFLSGSRHPDIRAWLDPARFATFRIEYGELVWGDYDLCFPVIDLYLNQIEHRASLDAAA